jgi:hypothetical protein
LQSRATMDALLPCHDQLDTPHWPELGITHLGQDAGLGAAVSGGNASTLTR